MWTRISALFFFLLWASLGFAQTRTTVADTVYTPSGQTLSGTLQVTAPYQITGPDGTVVSQGTTSTVSVTSGVFSIQLVPNVGSTPAGTYYNAIFRLSTYVIQQTWIVPNSGTAVKLQDVVTSSPPTPTLMFAPSQLNPPSTCTSGQQLTWTSGVWTCSSATGATIQTNGVANADQTVLNMSPSTTNAVGLTLTPTYSAGGVEKFEITGNSYTGNAATATALAATPTQCTGSQFATGVAANGNANCGTPAGASWPLTSPSGATIGSTSGSLDLAASGTNQDITLTPSGTGATVVNGLQDKGGQVYNVKAYGAKGDGVFLYQCSISNSSTNLTCSTASWTSADVGKPIEVDLAKATNNSLRTTISSVTDATHVVLAAAATQTSSNATVVYGDDDSSAVQSLINSVTNGGGGTIFFPPGIYVINAAPDTNNNVLSFPQVPWGGAALTHPAAEVELRGAVTTASSNLDSHLTGAQSVIYCMSAMTSGQSCLASSPGDGSYANGINNVQVTIDSLNWVVPYNETENTVYLLKAEGAVLRNLSVTVNNNNLGTNIPIPTATNWGITFPTAQNFGMNEAKNVSVIGFAGCFQFSEHTTFINTQGQHCNYVYWDSGGASPNYFFRAYGLDSNILLYMPANTGVYGDLHLESTPTTAKANATTEKIDGFLTFYSDGQALSFVNIPPTLSYMAATPGVDSGLYTPSVNPTTLQPALAGTTAGNLYWSQPVAGVADKRVVLNFQSFENTSATAQTATFPTAFTYAPAVVGCTLPTGVTVSTTAMSAASMSGTFTAQCILEGQ